MFFVATQNWSVLIFHWSISKLLIDAFPTVTVWSEHKWISRTLKSACWLQFLSIYQLQCPYIINMVIVVIVNPSTRCSRNVAAQLNTQTAPSVCLIAWQCLSRQFSADFSSSYTARDIGEIFNISYNEQWKGFINFRICESGWWLRVSKLNRKKW